MTKGELITIELKGGHSIPINKVINKGVFILPVATNTYKVGATYELRVFDSAGNATVFSPHNFSKIPNGASEEMAWSFYSERHGKYVNVDMMKVVRLVESLTEEQLVFIGEV